MYLSNNIFEKNIPVYNVAGVTAYLFHPRSSSWPNSYVRVVVHFSVFDLRLTAHLVLVRPRRSSLVSLYARFCDS